MCKSPVARWVFRPPMYMRFINELHIDQSEPRVRLS